MEIILQLIVNTVVAGSVYALIASGLSFNYATTRIFHHAHGAVIALTGFIFWWLLEVAGVSSVFSGFLALSASVALGLIMNEVVYEPLRARKTKGLGFLVAAIALLMLGNAFILLVFGATPRSLGVETPVYDLFGARISLLQIIVIIAALAALVALAAILKCTRLGKAMRAVSDNETVAEVLGVRSRSIRRATFALSSVLGGMAGIMIALEFNLDPTMAILIAVRGYAAMVIGGVGLMSGAILGSIVLAASEQAAVWYLGAGWKIAAAFVLLFVFLMVRPSGILGVKKLS
jgi:branched-chain amino acid transport system permease protein